MQPTKRYIQLFGLFSSIGSLLLNPRTLAYFFSADHKIESRGVIIVIVLFEIFLFVVGILALRTPERCMEIVRRRWKEAALLLVMYGLCEVVIMAIGIFLPRPTLERIRFFRDFTVPHQTLGYTMRPNLSNFELTWLDEDVKGVYDSDEYGFRNAGISYTSSSIFFIGDSFTQGVWVPREETYYGELSKQWGMPVISFGIGGYGVTQYEILARDFLPKTDIPKTVIIGFFANDLESPSPETAMPSLYEKEMLPQIAVPSFRNRFALKYSVAGQVLKHLFRPRERAVMKNGMSLFTNRGASISFARADYPVFQASLERLIGTLQSRSDVQKILFVLIPSRESVYAEEYAKLFGDASYLDNERFGFNRIKEVGGAAHIPVLDLAPVFRDHSQEKLYFDIDAHWNAAGHALAAQTIAAWIQSLNPIR